MPRPFGFTPARALRKVKETRNPEEVTRFVAKLRVFTITDQDGAGPWIRRTFAKWFSVISPGGNDAKATWAGILGERR
jgi:hypothetical protein